MRLVLCNLGTVGFDWESAHPNGILLADEFTWWMGFLLDVTLGNSVRNSIFEWAPIPYSSFTLNIRTGLLLVMGTTQQKYGKITLLKAVLIFQS